MATQTADWRQIVASALDWEQARVKLDSAIKNLPPELRAKRPNGLPHSVWQLFDHICRTQHDLLEFCVNDNYKEPHWPDDYWPSSETPTDAEWSKTIEAIRRDSAAFAEFTTSTTRDLTSTIPHGTGQTYLRTVLVAVDHMSYHVGQIVDVRRLLGSWPPT